MNLVIISHVSITISEVHLAFNLEYNGIFITGKNHVNYRNPCLECRREDF